MDGSPSRLEAVLRFKVDNISNVIRLGKILSEPTFAGNLPWRIKVQASKDGDKITELGFFLHCDGDKSLNWSCRAKATMKILSQEPATEPFQTFQRRIEHPFHAGQNDWGYAKFITWDCLMNPHSGYVKNDSVSLEVDMKLDDPAQSAATLKFKVENISRLETDQSPPAYIRNLQWRIEVFHAYQSTPKASLGIFLKCEGNRGKPGWSCGAVATIRIMPQKQGNMPFQRGIAHIFQPTFDDWGFAGFIDWQVLINPTNGYLKDDCIDIEIDVQADEPVGLEPQHDNDAMEQTDEGRLHVPSRYLECPICLELPRRQVYQCKSGHTICDSCINGVTTCPQCRERFGGERIRNRAVETMLDDLQMDCKFTGNGCTYKALRKHLPLHELHCVFNTV
ncbi:Ubiquitin carboxyl-terminal hydrolase 7 [Orchesella cincta]|uniref:Ubiquitin carboxyl-terminal hydrolase 7 n=1 Tax=Orchesella cincta TaxID=48709 RepID=A0A1D2MIT4_ORCCI|nr:Ubiquitin carboxyl-terminal hydrolase 7 [Orchesella cincta]